MSGMFDLDNKVALVSGGSRGIGAAIARAYAAAGARVAIAGRNPESLEEAATKLRESGARVLALEAHCGRSEDVSRLVAGVVHEFGGIDILVNNAATSPHFGPLLEASDQQWLKTIEVNVLGYVRLARLAAESMSDRGGGKIINVSSIAALRPLAGLGVYGVTKAAVSAATRTLALELAGRNIQVNALAPGLIRTSFSRALWEEPRIAEKALSRIPAGRIGEVDDLLGAAVFLASAASDYTTGLVMTVDGGYSVS